MQKLRSRIEFKRTIQDSTSFNNVKPFLSEQAFRILSRMKNTIFSLFALGFAYVSAQIEQDLELTVPYGAAGQTLHTTLDAEITLDAYQLSGMAYTATTTVRLLAKNLSRTIRLMIKPAGDVDCDGYCSIYGHSDANNDCQRHMCCQHGTHASQPPLEYLTNEPFSRSRFRHRRKST